MKQHFFHFDDGRQLSWFEVGEGPPLALLHGWSISAAAFTELAELLRHDFRILIPDLPGHGESSPAITNDLNGLAADLTAWMQQVTDEPVSLAGWSLGGMVSMQIASARLIALKRLVLIGTTPRFTNAEGWAFGLPAVQVHALARNLKRRFEKTLGDFFSLSLAGETVPLERLRTIRDFAIRNRFLPRKDVAMALLDMLAGQDQRECLGLIKCPVLVAHGTEDQISLFAAGQYIADMVEDGRLVEFPGVGHAPFWTMPSKFADTLREDY